MQGKLLRWLHCFLNYIKHVLEYFALSLCCVTKNKLGRKPSSMLKTATGGLRGTTPDHRV